MLKEDTMEMPYKQQHYVVTIRWCAYYSIEGGQCPRKNLWQCPTSSVGWWV